MPPCASTSLRCAAIFSSAAADGGGCGIILAQNMGKAIRSLDGDATLSRIRSFTSHATINYRILGEKNGCTSTANGPPHALAPGKEQDGHTETSA